MTDAARAVTAGEALQKAATMLAAAGVADARREARLLLAQIWSEDASTLLAHPERPLTAEDERSFSAAAARRARREPASRIAGRREFWSLPFLLNADTLDPRPDSETLVEAVMEARPDRAAPLSVLDLGTGTGCLLLAVLTEYPLAHGIGVDISQGALEAARANAVALGLNHRASFVQGDWGSGLSARFDVILCNPPYIPDGEIDALEPEVARWEPRLALAGGPDGLSCLRRLAPQLVDLLCADGMAAIEIGAGQADAASALLVDAGLQIAAIRLDLAGVPRCVLAKRG